MVVVWVVVSWAGGRIDDGGEVGVPTDGLGDDRAALVLSRGRVQAQVAQRTDQQCSQHPTP
jgi:hypothetical protein